MLPPPSARAVRRDSTVAPPSLTRSTNAHALTGCEPLFLIVGKTPTPHGAAAPSRSLVTAWRRRGQLSESPVSPIAHFDLAQTLTSRSIASLPFARTAFWSYSHWFVPLSILAEIDWFGPSVREPRRSSSHVFDVIGEA